jgi:two-component system chemotaxis response regulator CheY
MAVLSRERWKRLSFLVADDAGVVRAMIQMTLLSLGAGSVRMASDGEEALAELRQSPVDIVISDLNMLPVSGLEFLRSLRAEQDPGLAGTPVLVMSGYGEHEVKDEILAAGADAFLTKPARPCGIEEQVAAILESRNLLHPASAEAESVSGRAA